MQSAEISSAQNAAAISYACERSPADKHCGAYFAYRHANTHEQSSGKSHSKWTKLYTSDAGFVIPQNTRLGMLYQAFGYLFLLVVANRRFIAQSSCVWSEL